MKILRKRNIKMLQLIFTLISSLACLITFSSCGIICTTDYSSCSVCDKIDLESCIVKAYNQCKGGLLTNYKVIIVKSPKNYYCEIPLLLLQVKSVTLINKGKGLIGVKIGQDESEYWANKYFIQNINCRPEVAAIFDDKYSKAKVEDFREYEVGNYWISTSLLKLYSGFINIQIDFSNRGNEPDNIYLSDAKSISLVRMDGNNPVFQVDWQDCESIRIKLLLDNYLYMDDIVEVLKE